MPFHLVIWAQSLAFPKREIVRESVKCPLVKEERGGATQDSQNSLGKGGQGWRPEGAMVQAQARPTDRRPGIKTSELNRVPVLRCS